MEYKPEFLYLTTKGWKSGAAHEIEIWYIAHADRYYLCAGNREETHWVQNMRHDPQITFFVEGQHWAGHGRAVAPDAEPDLQTAVAALFRQKYNWNDGLLVQLQPEQRISDESGA